MSNITNTGINPKQQKFVDEYVIDRNITQAAIRAGYSEKAAHACGHRLMKYNGVQKAIIKAETEISKRTELTQEFVISELINNAKIAVELEQISAANQAIKLCGEHIGMFKKVIEHQGSDSKPIRHIHEKREEIRMKIEEISSRMIEEKGNDETGD